MLVFVFENDVFFLFACEFPFLESWQRFLLEFFIFSVKGFLLLKFGSQNVC